jgi:hypothetical protein
MKSIIDIEQNHKITLLIGGLAALGGITAFLIYLENRQTRKTEAQILALDKEIKELQLNDLRAKNSI